MFKISVTDEGIPLIWDADDWLRLREEHRIVGKLIGTLAGFPYQEGFPGLPLALMPEEATLLAEKKLAALVRYPSLCRSPGKGVKTEFEKYRKRIFEEQVSCIVEGRKKKVTEHIDNILEGKRRKSLGIATKSSKRRKKKNEDTNESTSNSVSCDTTTSVQTETAEETNNEEIIDKDNVLQEELNKINSPSVSSTNIQIFSTYPWLRKEDECKYKWKYPKTPSEILSYKVFKDFWEQGYYVTSAQKFGGDFLVYSGDPYKFHALYLVICIEDKEGIRPVDIATYGRLGSSVRKTVVLASCKNDDKISYQSVTWNGFQRDQHKKDHNGGTSIAQ